MLIHAVSLEFYIARTTKPLQERFIGLQLWADNVAYLTLCNKVFG